MRDNKGRFVAGHTFWDHPNVTASQFKKGAAGFRGKHTDATRAKLRARRLQQKNVVSIAAFRHLAVAANTGAKRTPEQRERIRAAHLGIKPSARAVEAARQRFTGSTNPKWRGGITPENMRIRQSQEMKTWRKAVFHRDNYRCTECGAKGNIQAHHIKPFALYPALRFDVGNGQTLCKPCHKKIPTPRWWRQYVDDTPVAAEAIA